MYKEYENVIVEQFESIAELLRVIKSRPQQSRGWNDSQDGSDRSWYGTSSFKEAEELLTNGWDKHLSKIKAKVTGGKLIKPEKGELNRRRPQTAVVGFTPHVPNAILNLPNSMIDIKQEPQKVKTITLILNTSVNAGWTPQEVLESGIAVLRLVNKIEQDGIKVKLMNEFKCSQSSYYEDFVAARVTLKNFKDHLDLKKIAFPFSNAGMMRRIGFKWHETLPEIKGNKWRNKGEYGSSLSDALNWETLIDTLKHYGLLKDNEYYITVPFCTNECDNDPVKLAEKLNIKY